MSQDYNSTLNLPKTDFPMRAGLPKSEPVTLKAWEDNKVYEKLMEVTRASLYLFSTMALHMQMAISILATH